MANIPAPAIKEKKKAASLFGSNIRQYTMIIALVVIVGLFGILSKGVSLLPASITDIILQNSSILILAIGMMLCILTGGNIDLSVGSVVCLIGALAAMMITMQHVPVWLGIVLGLAGGFAVGAFQGALIAYVKIPPFITTLAGMLLFRGLGNVILQGQTVGLPPEYVNLTNGYIPDPFHIAGLKLDPTQGTESELNILCVGVGVLLALIYVFFSIRKRYKKRKYNFDVTPMWMFTLQTVLIACVTVLFFVWLARNNGIPAVLILLGILIVGYSFFMQKTVPGRYIYAMGGNEKAARLSGINTKKVMFLVYMNMGILAGIAGLVFSARANAAYPSAGDMNELDAIGACFIGGASASGGVGTIFGAIVGALIMGVINQGMYILGVDSYWQRVIKGVVVLVSVAFDVFTKSRAKA
jgi:putative multiple sugar transport system permease protein